MTRVSIIGSGPMITRVRAPDDTPMEREGRRPLDEENVILVDAEDRPVGSAGKLIVHQKNMRHRAISVLIFDRAGRMLLQRRSASKYHSADLWSNAAAVIRVQESLLPPPLNAACDKKRSGVEAALMTAKTELAESNRRRAVTCQKARKPAWTRAVVQIRMQP